MRKAFFAASVFMLVGVWALWHIAPMTADGLAFVVVPTVLLGAIDCLQSKHSLRRNFPVLAHARWLMEMMRPEIYQYFVESNRGGRPFDRERRSIVYQRAKKQLDSLPFGTQDHVYNVGYEWINHSLLPTQPPAHQPRITFGNARCKKPYDAALLNVSAMSYGALSKNAVRALNKGAKLGGFFHNTGEGGLSPYHLENGGDLVWQLGTGYFGARTHDGQFDAVKFQEGARHEQVRMIEIKLSQGAKPGHGGILPASKLTPEIAKIRNVPMGADVVSPPAHTAFRTPLELMDFVEHLRGLSMAKPIGFKLCVGRPEELLAIGKAMLERDIYPDFITVDGGEGGTGAAPLEFSNSIGTPLKEGLTLVHNMLVGLNIREHVRVIAAGKVITGFDLARHLALGADTINCARAMMFALGCIQALRCNNNTCPTGVATQDASLMGGLVVADKALRVKNFQHETVHSLLDVVAAAGLETPSRLAPHHIMRRVSATSTQSFAQLYPPLAPGSLLSGHAPAMWRQWMDAANAERFA